MTTARDRERRRSDAESWRGCGFAAWVAICAAAALLPILVLLVVSVAPGAAIFGERPALIVTGPDLPLLARRPRERRPLGPLVKSLVVAALTTAGALAIAAPGAYVIARLPARLRYGIVVGLLVTRMFPEFAIGVSVATRFAQLGLADTYAGARARPPHRRPAVRGLAPRGGVRGGAPRRRGGGRHRRRLASGDAPAASSSRWPRPALAVAALFAWLYSWNEFLYARLLTTSQNTLPLQVFQAIDRGTRQQMAAVAIVLVLPILGVVAVLQRHLRPGALAGAIRG